MAAQHMGQTELAQLSGVSQPKISAWLAGRSGMSERNLLAITRALGLELRPAEVPKRRSHAVTK